MKRLLAFLLLVSHMNTSMFLPQAPMQDVYDANGNQLDDITSIVELVRVKLGFDHKADDENDDSGQNFHMVNIEYTLQPFFGKVNNDFPINHSKEFFAYKKLKIPAMSYDILVPPPKA